MNLVVTTNEKDVIKIDFNNYYLGGYVPFSVAYYSSKYLTKAHLMPDHILAWGTDGSSFIVIAPNGDLSKGLVVDSINGTAPTDLNHLFELVNTIIK